MASSSGEVASGPDQKRLDSKELPSICSLGKGLSGFIYETKWKGIKYARKDFPLGSEECNSVFKDEVKSLFALDDPNIVKCFGYTVGDSSCSLLLEYVDSNLQNTIQRSIEAQRTKNSADSSGTLRLRIVDVDEVKGLLSSIEENRKITGVDEGTSKTLGRSNIPFEVPEAVNIISQIVAGMKYLHDNRVVHGDLKPKNVLLYSESGSVKVKLADFGLVETKKRIKLVSKRTQHFEILMWKAPEQFEELLGPLAKDLDDPFTDSDTDDEDVRFVGHGDDKFKILAMSDVYSFGLICSHILGGKLLCSNLSLTQLREQRMHIGFKPEMLSATCPDFLRGLIYSCLDFHPLSRPTFSDISSALNFKALHPLPLRQLMKGADKETHEFAATEFEAAAREARKKDHEARELRLEAAKLQLQAVNIQNLEAAFAQAEEHRLELNLAAAAKEALEHRAYAKRRAKAALVAHRQSRPPFKKPTENQLLAAKERIQYEKGKTHVAVCGVSGSGKSSLINAIRGLNPGDEGAARVGVTESTMEVTRYPDPRHQLPFIWYDIPGAGISDAQYFEKQGLFAFDRIILVYSDPFTNVDIDIIKNCVRFGISIVIVRSKADQHIDNMIRDDDEMMRDNEDQIYEDMKAKYIDYTKSDFNMHKEIMTEILDFEDVAELLFSLDVYIVCARNVGSLMQERVAKERGLHNNKIAAKMFDEALLIEQILHIMSDRKMSLSSDRKISPVPNARKNSLHRFLESRRIKASRSSPKPLNSHPTSSGLES